tara:strand:- start:1955 stop:3091 length:1137 start_codon:yes stop_codon:yes gene_type:complete
MTNPRKMMMAAAGGSSAEYNVFAWGDGKYGGLGQGNTTNYSSPVQVGSFIVSDDTGNFIDKIGSGQFTTLINNSDGKIYSVGRNADGQLGHGNTTDLSTVTGIGSLTTWTRVSAAAAQSSMALKSDGTVWVWGSNNIGRLGVGNTTNYSSPIQLGALTTWAFVDAGYQSGHAIKTDATMWGWGKNSGSSWEVGNNSSTNISSPVQIGATSDWSKVYSVRAISAAIKTDGTIWTWGNGALGGLGHNNTTNVSSPVKVGALTDWAQIAVGRYGVVAVKSDGTMWAWGRGASGVNGDGTATNRSSPVQIGSETTWLQASRGEFSCAAVKTDGTLWTWGNGNLGVGGRGDAASTTAPLQVGSDTDWKAVEVRDRHCVGIKAA